jgi:serine/threonine protein kinase
MDYVPEGDLGGLVAARGNLAELSAKSLATQMLSALKYLHDKGITHRDIKPDNILVQSFNPFHVKLTDFGLSKRIENDDTFMRTFCGTLLYCAPEVYSEYSSYFESPSGGRNRAVVDKKSKRYDQGVDLWSLAGVLFYTLCGSPPYPAKSGTTYQQLLHNIMTGALDVRPLQRADVSQDGIDFIKSMLHTQPQYRPTIDELENSRWLRDGSVQVSLDGSIEEVDMIGQGEQYELEQSASQLSIAEESKDSFGTSDEVDLINAIVAAQDLEIPSSFISADSNSSGDNVQLTHDSSTTNHRLFGEVNASALGSSGVIPQHQLNLLLSTSPGQFTSSNLDQTTPSFVNVGVRDYNMASNDSSQGETTPPEEYKNMPSSPTLGIVTAPSLMGAESLVGNLAMNSPSPTPPGAPSPQPYPQPALQPVAATTQSAVTIAQPAAMTPIPDFRESMRSLRRQRDPTGDDEPLAKRTKSSRALDMEISKTVFWDARDRSTHHLNYPVMTTSEYQEAKALAALAGEEFKHGGSVFETIVGPYTRSTSATPEPPSRAQSEPTSGGPAQLNRDERGLSESRNVVQTGSWINGVPSAEICQYLPEFSKSSNGAPKPVPKPVLDNGGFQVPDRILAKLIGTPDSVLPNITLNATSILTTWGRGAENKLRHADLKDTRVPKYGIKLILWQPGVKPCSGPPTDKNNTHAFYIATKASQGIKVNGVIIPSHDCRLPQKPSIYWGKLQHGDIVDVWTQDSNATQFVRFRFECFWGESKEPRKEGQFFALMGPGTLRDELDRFCEWEESAFCQAKYASELKAMSERENHNQKGWAA